MYDFFIFIFYNQTCVEVTKVENRSCYWNNITFTSTLQHLHYYFCYSHITMIIALVIIENYESVRPCLVRTFSSLSFHHSVFITHHPSSITHHSSLKISQFSLPCVWILFSLQITQIFHHFLWDPNWTPSQ